MSAAERLYTPELLSLTLELAKYPYRGKYALHGSARSRSCGSTLALGLLLDDEQRIETLGMQVKACAIGQATAALFADYASGKRLEELAASRREMESWLAGSGARPDLPRLELIAPARDFPARHGAMMLSWDAAIDALSSMSSNG